PLLPLLAILVVISSATITAAPSEWSIQKNIFQLTNQHRAHAVLQFSINGATVVKVVHTSPKMINVELSDKKSSIEIQHLDGANKDVDEYLVTWKAAGPSLEHEVCFHYRHNNASW